MKYFFNKNKLLVVIMILAAVVRLWNLNNVPPHLTPDEAALGYNAYSILKTGRDEHGKLLPIVFKSFGDYKPGLYVYATIPFVATLGLNEWSVRLPSAISGIIIVYLIYLIVKQLFGNGYGLRVMGLKHTTHNTKQVFELPLCSALVAATNPWLITFSRGAWEVNLSLMLSLLGVYLFLKSLNENKYLLYSVVSFALTFIAYQGAKLSTGIIVLLLGIIYWKEFWRIEIKTIVKSVVVGLIIVSPILLSIVNGQSGRLEVFSVFSYPRSTEYVQNMLNEGNEKIGDINYYLYHGESYNFLRGVLGRFFNHFSGRFLFFEGDFSNPRHSAPYQGQLLLIDIILLIAGLVFVIRNYSLYPKSYSLIILWLVLAPLPAILSRDQVHAVRSLNMAVPLVIISAIGLAAVLNQLRVVSYVFLAFYFLSSVYFLDAYFVHLPIHQSKLWEYGYKQIVETVTPIQNNYKKVVVQQSFAQPYIYFLFFNRYSPAKYQSENSYVNSENKLDVGYVTKIDNVYFEAIDWSRNRGDHGVLFVADTLRIPPLDSNDEREFKLIKEIKYLDNLNTAFRILEVKTK